MKKKVLIIIIILMILSTGFYFAFHKRILDTSLNKNSNNDYSSHDTFTDISTATSDSGASFFHFSDVGVTNFASKATDSTGTMGSSSSSGYLGYSTGGAKTIKNFRENIEYGYFPISTDITYNGLFYDYSFDTGNARGESEELFYPSYSTAISKDIYSENEEYYMSVGLNSNIKESDFVRPKLNLVIVLDNSGSMGASFNSYYYDGYSNRNSNSKMAIANQCVNILLDQLSDSDRFGMVIFNSTGQIAKYLNEIGDTNIPALKENILNISDTGGTNFEDGYQKALEVFENLGEFEEGYQNRIIVITDAMPNYGNTNSSSLLEMVETSAKNKIYTSFVGVGVDFNTELIEKLGTVEGANYFSVHNQEEFETQMGSDFDYMVTPLVFDLNLNFSSNDFSLETVYGTDIENNKKGNIMHVNTLFPSKRNDSGEVKGGIILLKLKKKNHAENGKVTLEVTYRDAHEQEHKNNQEVYFEDKDTEYFDNTGIRKGIVLTRYANLLKDWILFERSNGNKKFLVTENTGIIEPDYTENEISKILGEHERTSVSLTVSEKYKNLFKEMKNYVELEMEELNDRDLQQEIDILEKLINEKNQSTYEEYSDSWLLNIFQ